MCTRPTFSSLLKRCKTAFLPHERIKLGGCSLEFKLNLNSNANQPIFIHSWCEKKGAWVLCAWRIYTRNFFSCRVSGAQVDKVVHEISCPFKFKLHLNLNGQPIIFIHPNGTQMEGHGMASVWEKIYENSFLMNSNGCRWSEVAQGEKSKWFEPNWANLIKIG